MLPPALRTGDLGAVFDECATVAECNDSEPSVSEGRCSLCTVGTASTSGLPSRLVGRDAGRSSDLRDAVSRLRLGTSGLCLARLDVVGDANEGLWGDREGEGCGSDCSSCCGGGGPGGVVDSTGTASVGEVLRRLGAEGSISGGLWATSGHACHGIIYERESTLCDASHCVVVKDRRVLDFESCARRVLSRRCQLGSQLIVYLRPRSWVGSAPKTMSTDQWLIRRCEACTAKFHYPVFAIPRAQDLLDSSFVSIQLEIDTHSTISQT